MIILDYCVLIWAPTISLIRLNLSINLSCQISCHPFSSVRCSSSSNHACFLKWWCLLCSAVCMLGFGTQDTEWIVLFELSQEMYSALVGILPWLWVILLCLMSPYWCSRKLKTTLFLVKIISTLHLLLKLWGRTSNCSRNYNYCPWDSNCHNCPSLRQYKK